MARTYIFVTAISFIPYVQERCTKQSLIEVNSYLQCSEIFIPHSYSLKYSEICAKYNGHNIVPSTEFLIEEMICKIGMVKLVYMRISGGVECCNDPQAGTYIHRWYIDWFTSTNTPYSKKQEKRNMALKHITFV